MSESNKPELTVIEPEVMPGLSFDFEFITQTLNLIPIQGGKAAIALAAITDIEQDENDDWVFTLDNDQQYTLDNNDMAEFEQNLRRRIEDNKTRAKDAMRDNARIQAELMAEFQGGVQPGKIVGVGRKGFH
jgi:hypothetical protein